MPDLTLPDGASVTVTEYSSICKGTKHIQLDVRSATQFGIVSFDWYDLQGRDLKNLGTETNGGSDKQSVNDSTSEYEGEKDSSSLRNAIIANTIDVISFPFMEIKNMDKKNIKSEIFRRLKEITDDIDGGHATLKENNGNQEDYMDIGDVDFYCICRRGNDSILATQILRESGFQNVFNVSGGLTAWSSTVDPAFPMY